MSGYLTPARKALQDQYFERLDKGEQASDIAIEMGLPCRTGRRWAEQWSAIAKSKGVAAAILASTPNQNKELVASKSRFGAPRHRGLKDYKRIVVVSVQNDTATREDFYDSIRLFCKMNDAFLAIVPIFYRYSKLHSVFNVDPADLFFEDVALGPRITLMGRLSIVPTIVDPFAGLDPLTKLNSILVATPQTRLKTMPSIGGMPSQMIGTGSISDRKGAYPRNKTGIKAEFNHSNAAVVIELGAGDSFFHRYLNCDDKGGFYDVVHENEGYYSPTGFTPLNRVAGLQPGDSHYSEADPVVLQSTFFAEDSIAKVCNPMALYQHDSLSFNNQNHHDDKNPLLKWAKFHTGRVSVESELDITGELMTKVYQSMQPDCKMYIVESNHDQHADQWLVNCDPKKDFVNAKFYHWMMYQTMNALQSGHNGPKLPAFYPLWLENSKWSAGLPTVEFLDGSKSHKLFDIEQSQHGHSGANGSRGSLIGFARLPGKMSVGHSHTSGIIFGCWQAGTSSWMDLPYVGPISSWMHAHIITHLNGKRQMIHVINGKWRLLNKK